MKTYKKLFRAALIIPLLFCFLSVSYFTTAQTTDTKLITMQADDWSLKVDSTLAIAVESNNKPFMTTLKDGTEKELFLILNSPTDAAAGKIEFKVETTGLTIYKQLPLDKELTVGEQYDFVNATHAMLKDRVVVYRPENVVNSFACFDQSGQKVLHIYASKLIDAKGASVRVDSDLKDGILTVYLDSKFLEIAVFPVVVDPTFGYTSVGASDQWFTGNSAIGTKASLNASAEPLTVSLYCKAVNDDTHYNVSCGIYTQEDPANKILITAEYHLENTTAGWINLNILSPTTLAIGDYYLFFNVKPIGSTNEFAYYFDTVTGYGYNDNLVYNYPTSWTNTIDDEWTTDRKCSIYVNYDITPEPTPTATPTAEPTATPTPTVIYQAIPINYLNSVALIFLAIVCIALTIKPQVPILNFIFGVIVLGISAATAGQTDMLLWGYMPLLTVILAIVCMLSGYVSWKR